VMKDFFARHRAGDIRISVNDAGATPAIVSLRLDQALETYKGRHR
jgi:malonate decarboxylase delta subunit